MLQKIYKKSVFDDFLLNEDNLKLQLLCMTILNKIACFVGQELCEFYLVPQLFQFSEEYLEEKKLSCIENLTNVAKTVSEECQTSKVMPILFHFTKETNVKVKKSLCLNLLNYAKIIL